MAHFLPRWYVFNCDTLAVGDPYNIEDSPIEIVIGTVFLYKLLGMQWWPYVFIRLMNLCVGVSCFFGLAVTCLFLPMNHWAGKVVVVAQDSLMKARDERVSLMNEILAAIRMLKVFSSIAALV